jgi:hypothetical protein
VLYSLHVDLVLSQCKGCLHEGDHPLARAGGCRGASGPQEENFGFVLCFFNQCLFGPL